VELACDRWQCDCHCDGMYGFGRAGSKTKAKKKAAYMMIIHLLVSAGICEKEWQADMYDFVLDE
jgi:ribonuclease-3